MVPLAGEMPSSNTVRAAGGVLDATSENVGDATRRITSSSRSPRRASSTTSRAQAVIQCLRELGIVVSIDDFGAGFTSLAYLSSLAVG
jgi:predicted signal transduction protein with EAL and GGDEF domain